jgi:large subunit ribosomal protein L17
MRHGKTFRKLSRQAAHRRAMMRNMVTSLIEHEQIKTTDAKAKEISRVAERMITLAKDGSLHARRQALSYVRTKGMVHKLFTELGPRFANRPGGYVQINKLGPRRGDGAPISVVSLVAEEVKKPRRLRRRRKKAKGEAKAQPETKKAAQQQESGKKAKAQTEAKAESQVEAKQDTANVPETGPATGENQADDDKETNEKKET